MVVVIDSGLSSRHNFDNIVGGICLKERHGKIILEDTYEDEIGHGTAIVDILLTNSNQISIFCIKIFENDFNTTFNKLCYALEYIYKNISCDFIQLSAGVTILDDYERLKSIVDKLYERGTIIISAFDNEGSISYPAALENVIGIDITNNCKKNEYEIVENSVIDIRGTSAHFRVKWVNPEKIIINGSSFTAAYILSIIINLVEERNLKINKGIILHNLKSDAKKIYKGNSHPPIFNNKDFISNIHKAIAFPFNKEIYPLAIFPDLLNFEIIGFYDTKYSRNINKKVSEVSKLSSCDKIINDYFCINWDSDFDTVICGHCKEISHILGYDINRYFIEQCVKYKKKIYMFDYIHTDTKILKALEEFICYPYVDNSFVKQNRFGKLRHHFKPIVGVFGTSSKQGKYTLQLWLRKALIDKGYNVGQIGTEPSGYMFGFEFVFPMGYNSSIFVTREDSVKILNEELWKIEEDDPDIIIVGSQSGTIPYDTGNIACYMFSQYDFLMGTLPDAIILCVNPNDNIDYVKHTIGYIENVICSRVIAISVFPVELVGNSAIATRKELSRDVLIKTCEKFEENTGIPTFSSSLEDIDNLVECLLLYFS